MGERYVLGVDGGNTKTDYFLCDLKGNIIDAKRAGTCSHERLKDGYEGAYREMYKQIEALLVAHHLKAEQIEVAVFGLAGLDLKTQKYALEQVIKRMGFKNYIAENDGYLGLKAGTTQGYGICCINGTGTVTVGVNQKGERLQVGGVGYLSADDAGGAFITRKLLREIYMNLYGINLKTGLIKPMFNLLEIKNKEDYLEKAIEVSKDRALHTPYIQLLLEYADKNDPLAIKIVKEVAYYLAQATAGCSRELNMHQQKNIEIVLAGSVWVKPKTPILQFYYKEYLEDIMPHTYQYHLLEVPPAMGAIIWALEIVYQGKIQRPILEKVKKENYKIL